jgi:hypothetical protein
MVVLAEVRLVPMAAEAAAYLESAALKFQEAQAAPAV